jgi:hypothetical protein
VLDSVVDKPTVVVVVPVIAATVGVKETVVVALAAFKPVQLVELV